MYIHTYVHTYIHTYSERERERDRQKERGVRVWCAVVACGIFWAWDERPTVFACAEPQGMESRAPETKVEAIRKKQAVS